MKQMNKLKVFINLIIAFIFLLLTTLPVTAADLNIDCPAPPTTCSKTGTDPLFTGSADGYWYPGRSLIKKVNLKNSSSEKREMAIKGTKTSPANILEDVMHISIVGGTTIIWSGSVANFYGQDKIGMGIFNPGVDFDYDFTVSMSSKADNDYQNRQTVFDLTFSTSTPAPTATPTPAPGFLPNVLGEATPSGELGEAPATEEGKIAGTAIAPRNRRIWFLIGLIGFGGGFVLYLRFFRKK